MGWFGCCRSNSTGRGAGRVRFADGTDVSGKPAVPDSGAVAQGGAEGCRRPHGKGHEHRHGQDPDDRLGCGGLCLDDLLPGEQAIVTGFSGGIEYRRKLLSMGMVPGCRLECLRGGRGSGMLIRLGSAAGSATLMLNSGMTDRIAVRRLSA